MHPPAGSKHRARRDGINGAKPREPRPHPHIVIHRIDPTPPEVGLMPEPGPPESRRNFCHHPDAAQTESTAPNYPVPPVLRAPQCAE